WTASNRDFARYPSQQSAPVTLAAGTCYYVEAVHKQSWGPGYVAVAWRLPDGSRLEPIPANNLIPFATTAARGVAATNGSSTTGSSLSRTELSVFPNPFSSNATIEFNTLKSGAVMVELFNLQGQRVRKLYTGDATAGTPQRVTLDAPGLSTGTYLVRLTTGNEVVNQRVSYIAR
ncbi:T9SS type A sorting domain-containing protein, partial [Hymenobacter negativus]